MRQVSPRFLENKVNNLANDMEHLAMDPSEVCNVNSEVIPQNDTNGKCIFSLVSSFVLDFECCFFLCVCVKKGFLFIRINCIKQV